LVALLGIKELLFVGLELLNGLLGLLLELAACICQLRNFDLFFRQFVGEPGNVP
jgi:hypothetical protein